MRGRVGTATGGEEAGHGAADINNNYWFEPLSVRDLSNLKITSEINYVRLISPGPRSVYRCGYYAGRRPPSIARVCVLTPPGPLLSTLHRRSLRHRCPLGQVVLLAAPLPPSRLTLVLILPNYEQRARARPVSALLCGAQRRLRGLALNPLSCSPFSVLIVGKFFHKNKKADRIIRTSAATDPIRQK